MLVEAKEPSFVSFIKNAGRGSNVSINRVFVKSSNVVPQRVEVSENGFYFPLSFLKPPQTSDFDQKKYKSL